MNISSISFRHEWVQSILGALLSALIALTLWNSGFLEAWEGKTWDWRASQMAEPSSATDDICLILVDQSSLDWMKDSNGLNWPWPREIYSVVVDFCKRNGAKALAFDVLFTEPSSYGVEDDIAFGKAVADYGKVASAAFLKKLSGSYTKWPENTHFSPMAINGVSSWLDSPSGQACLFPKAVMPIPELISTSAMICNVQQEPDPDGIYRRTRMISIFDNHVVPSLGLGIFFAKKNIQAVSEAINSSPISIEHGLLKIENRKIPLDEKGEAILRYRGASGTHKTYSAAAVIQSEIEFRNSGEKKTNQKKMNEDNSISNKISTLGTNEFKGKYVFFSFSAPGLFDLRSSPVDSVYPGVEIQATILDNFLADDFISNTPRYFVILLVILWSMISAVLITFLKGSVPLVLAGVASIILPTPIALAAYEAGIWLPLVVLETCASLSVIFSLGINYLHEGRQRRFIKNAFSQYLSPVFIEQLIKHPEKLKLGGERKELSIFFSDLQGFTSISEKLSPEELTALLNNYLSAMTEIIHEEGGTVDKYEGDAIIAFWNAPLDVPNHGACAVRAALRCQKKLAEMRPEMKKIVGTDMRMRIGLNTGVVVVGNMGSHSRFDYTMLGDSVNLAARLEGANKQFGTYTMISESTRNKAIEGISLPDNSYEKEFAFREIARLAVVGKKEAVTVFEPMSSDEFTINYDIYSIYEEGLQLFYKGKFEEALDSFSLIADRDAPASAYIKKCNELIEHGADTDWNGVWTMTSK